MYFMGDLHPLALAYLETASVNILWETSHMARFVMAEEKLLPN